MLDRTITNYHIDVNKKLRDLYKKWEESSDNNLLKYYQYIVVNIICDPEFGIDGINNRGILVNHTMGMGKTRLAAAIAYHCMKFTKRRIITMMPNSLKNNFETTMRDFISRKGDEFSEMPPINYVTMDAYNASTQLPDLENSLLIIDEAHDLFSAIVNGSKNGQMIYEKVMATKNIIIVPFTGTMPAKDPFELVPCFNMLAGYDLLPPMYSTFEQNFINGTKVKNADIFLNRITGLISHVSSKLPIGISDGVQVKLEPGDDGWYPVELPMKTMEVEMSEPQYRAYLMARQKELVETSRSFRNDRMPNRMMLPSANSSASSSYYVKSRTISNYYSPEGLYDVDASPKMDAMAKVISSSEGISLVYSQFVNASGIKIEGKYLEKYGFEPFTYQPVTGGAQPKQPYRAKTAQRSERNYYTPKYNGKSPIAFEDCKCEVTFIDPGYTDIEAQYIRDNIDKPFYTLVNVNNDISDEINYKESRGHINQTMDIELNLHHGQRKLLLTLIRCFNKFSDHKKQLICVYAGSAPGNNIPLVMDMFPNIIMHCYDPADFSDVLKRHSRIKYYNQFFTDETAKEWEEKCDIFISDIRQSIEDATEFNKAVDEDNQRQDRWIQIIKPRLGAMVKFRPAYIELTDTSHVTTTMKADIEIQCWPPVRSSETRLMVSPPYTTMTFNTLKYDRFMYVHNIIDRNWCCYPIIDKSVATVPGFDRCYDCTFESYTWHDYLKRPNVPKRFQLTVGELMNIVTQHIHQRLDVPFRKSFHGLYPEMPRCKSRQLIWKETTLATLVTGGRETEITTKVQSMDKKYPVNKHIISNWDIPYNYLRTRFIATIDFLTKFVYPQTKYTAIVIEGVSIASTENGYILNQLSYLFPNITWQLICLFAPSDKLSLNERIYVQQCESVGKITQKLQKCKQVDFLISYPPIDSRWIEATKPKIGVMCTENKIIKSYEDPPINRKINITHVTEMYSSYQYAYMLWNPGVWHYISNEDNNVMPSENISELYKQHDISRPYVTYESSEEIFIDGFDNCYDCCAEVAIWKKYKELYKLDGSGKKGQNVTIDFFMKTTCDMCRISTLTNTLQKDGYLHGECGKNEVQLMKMLQVEGGMELQYIRIKDINESQAKQLIDIHNNELIMPFIGDGNRWTTAYVAELIKYDNNDFIRKNDYNMQWIIQTGDVVIGYISLRPVKRVDGVVQLRYFVDPDFRGNSIATEAVKMVISNIGKDILSVWAQINPENKASIRAVEKAGFAFLKKSIEFQDYLIYSYKIRDGVEVDLSEATKTFPYRKNFIKSPQYMWKMLAIDIVKPSWNGNIFARTFPDQYENIDSISDHFAEHVRIHCKERGHKSPVAVWNGMKVNKQWSKVPIEARKQRERIYMISRGCNLFNAALAVAVYDRYGIPNCKILDPAAGWGDRLIAACRVNAELYDAFDTNPLLQSVYDDETRFCHSNGSETKCQVRCEPFEKAEVKNNFYNIVFVSPPFYDKELYIGDDTSTTLYQSYEEWLEKYFKAMLLKSVQSLADNGYLITYLPPSLIAPSREILEPVMEFVEVVAFQQIVKDKQPISRESLVWRKHIFVEGGNDDIDDNEKDMDEYSANFWPLYSGGSDNDKTGFKYAIISGETPKEERDYIMKIATSVDNINGDLIKCLLVSKTGAQGLDLKCVRHTHQMEPYWHMSRANQFKSRAIRMGSHDMLPKDKRIVQPYMWVSTMNKKVWNLLPATAREELTIDQMFMVEGQRKHELCEQFRALLLQVCFECNLFGYSKCRSCQPNNTKLFHKDYMLDFKSKTDPCLPVTKQEVKVKSVVMDEIEYKYSVDDGHHEFYEEQKLGWVEIPITDPRYELLLQLVA